MYFNLNSKTTEWKQERGIEFKYDDAKSLAERNQRDLQTQGEQAERHRLAETLDFEIKRWAAGNEGNLRALLSTLHYAKALAEKNQRDLQTQRAS
ncbi:auxilin-related protein 2-like isoform X3 [Arachis ipaensis]|uniref:auxilin-related protein 2-like isoform X3 n=1 Tax=Arachis ipaensis TaxID=130454 RepID=UPI000A2B7A9D|nr:auxilin-related protein 2-like isoform X3 [Arachis ipaensis]XP_020979769.1 auxilin-related protein 2-like isoform X3 [Arachis ipaensis]